MDISDLGAGGVWLNPNIDSQDFIDTLVSAILYICKYLMLVHVNLEVLVKILPLCLTIMFGEVKALFSSGHHVIYW